MKLLVHTCLCMALVAALGAPATNEVAQSTTNTVTKGKLPIVIRGTAVEDATGSARGSPESRALQYTGYDAGGSIVVTGRLSIVITTNSPTGSRTQERPVPSEWDDYRRVTGIWTLAQVVGTKNIGPQVGSGRLDGLAKGSNLHLNLNPDEVDNNVHLQGEVSSGRFTGIWHYSTFVGAVAEGKFVAQ